MKQTKALNKGQAPPTIKLTSEVKEDQKKEMETFIPNMLVKMKEEKLAAEKAEREKRKRRMAEKAEKAERARRKTRERCNG